MQQLEQAITLACHPSSAFSQLARAVARNSAEELAAAARLREVAAAKGLSSGSTEAVQHLTAAIAAAEVFPRLAGQGES